MNQNLMGIMKNLILYPQGRPSPLRGRGESSYIFL